MTGRNPLISESETASAADGLTDDCGDADQSPETIGAQAQAEEVAVAVANKPVGPSRLVGATLNYGLGSILPQVINFLLIPVYTRFLSGTDIGTLDLAGSFGLILVVVMRLGMPGAVTRFYFDHREGAGLQDYVTTVNRFLWFSSITIGGLIFGLAFYFGDQLLPGVAIGYIGLVVVMSILSCNTDLQRRMLQAREQSRYTAILTISTALANVVLAIVFVAVFRMGMNGMFLAQFLAIGAFFLQARVYLAPDLKGRFQSHFIRPTLQYGAGIVLSHFLGNFGPYYVRSLLAGRESLEVVGLFGIASRFTNPLMIAFTAFNTAFIPIYFAARKHESAEAEENLTSAVRNTWTLALFLFLGTICLAPPAILIMTPQPYHAAAPLVRVLAVGLMGQAIYLLFTPEIFYRKKTWMITVVTFFGVTVTVGMSNLLVDRYGLYGVAWSTAMGQVASGLLGGILSFSLERRSSLKWSCIARTTLIAAAVGSLLLLPEPINPFLALLRGAGLVATFVALSWVFGDPSLRQLSRLAVARFS
ncbi:N/A [soil metagenome]